MKYLIILLLSLSAYSNADSREEVDAKYKERGIDCTKMLESVLGGLETVYFTPVPEQQKIAAEMRIKRIKAYASKNGDCMAYHKFADIR